MLLLSHVEIFSDLKKGNKSLEIQMKQQKLFIMLHNKKINNEFNTVIL